MTTGFDKFEVLLLHRQGADCLLPEGMEFNWRGGRFRHRPGGHTDGLSSPQFLHCITDADSDTTWAFLQAVAHDGGYHDDLEQLCNGIWKPITLEKSACDQMFKELMDTMAITEKQKAEAIAFYEAVHLGGQAAFDAGRAAKGKS